MRKLFRWLLRIFVAFTLLVVLILALAYWNRDKVFKMVTRELNKGVNGEFIIDKLDFTFFHHFPNFSLTLHNVYLRNDDFNKYHKDIFFAKKVFLDIRLFPLLKNEIQIKSLTLERADIFVFRTHDGYANSNIFKREVTVADGEENDKEHSHLLMLHKIDFRNVGVTYADSVKNKFMQFTFLKTSHAVTHVDSIYSMTLEGDMHVQGLIFDTIAGGFLTDKKLGIDMTIRLNQGSNVIEIDSSLLKYNESVIGVSGRVELDRKKRYAFKFKATDVSPIDIKPLLNSRLIKSLKKFDIRTPITIKVDIAGMPPNKNPYVDVAFDIKNTSFRYNTLNFSSLTTSGTFTNHLDSTRKSNNSNSQLNIHSFNGIMQDIPVNGKVTFTALDDPIINAFITTQLNFSQLNDHINTNRILFKSGTFTSEISYKGKLDEYLDSTRTTYKGKLNGSITALNTSLYYVPKKMFIDKINTICEFTEKKFTIHTLTLELMGSPVKIKGHMLNFIPFFVRPKNKGHVKLSVTSPDLDLTPFAAKTKREKKAVRQNRQPSKKLTALFDLVYHTLEFDLDLKVDKLTFRTFNAKDVEGKVTLFNTKLEAQPITMKIAGGTANLGFALTNLFDPVSPMHITLTMNDTDIKSLFDCFSNFNQQTIQAENISGILSADVKFNADIDDRYAIIAPTMKGILTCKIKNGVLTDFEPLQNMSNFLFKKRNFSDVQFAELNSNFSVQGTTIDIKRMEIQSSVLSLFLQGRYSFTDSTSLSVQLPLTNLKKRDKNFKPENIGTDVKAGPSVFLHVHRNKDIHNKVKIDYDPFKKWVRK